MSRLVATLVALIAALLGAIGPGPAIAATAPAALTYSYNGHHDAVVLAYTATERGPPTCDCNRETTYDAVDRWSHGVAARPGGLTPFASTTDTTTAPAARATTTTGGQVEVADGDLYAFGRERCRKKQLLL